MTLLEKLKTDYQAFQVEREFPLWEVNALGYLATAKFLPIGEPAVFRLIELVHEDKKPCTICYLLHIRTNTGFFMPESYQTYLGFLGNKE